MWDNFSNCSFGHVSVSKLCNKRDSQFASLVVMRLVKLGEPFYVMRQMVFAMFYFYGLTVDSLSHVLAMFMGMNITSVLAGQVMELDLVPPLQKLCYE